MYEKCGFIKHAEQDDKVVVRKVLNPSGDSQTPLEH